MRDNPAPSSRGRKTVIVVLVAALAAAVIWVVILLMQRPSGPDQGSAAPSTTSATSPSPSMPSPSATSPTPSASDLPSTLAPSLPGAEAATVIWPDPEGTLRYETPEAAASGFAEDFAEFTDPVYGKFMQGDTRSGELEIRPTADGAITTLLLRQLSDGQWYAIGATSSEIRLDTPASGATVVSPLALSGASRAFEATVQVKINAHGTADPLGTGMVMGGSGPELAPFSGSIQWENPGTGSGVLLLFVSSAKDGSVLSVTAVPVGFAAQP